MRRKSTKHSKLVLRHVIAFEEGGSEPMISFQNRECVALVHPNQQCTTEVVSTAQTLTDCLNLRDTRLNPSGKAPRSDALGNVEKQKTSVSDLSPLRTRKNADELQVLGLDFYFAPLSIVWQFMPHVPTTAIQKCPSQSVFCRVCHVSLEHETFEPLVIMVKFIVMKLAFQEFGDDFRRRDSLQTPHSALPRQLRAYGVSGSALGFLELQL
jgi:hypothetical protein